RKAYCPAKVVEFNPVLEINKYILFAREGFTLRVDRPTKYGGPVDYSTYEELEKDFVEGKLHPLDLKNATADALIELLEPVRKAILSDKEAVELINYIRAVGIRR
ncbi:MAG: tyrosine--tRNA ligase, partial [Desulfurococcales archaeon]|nr:tyrosine--tRNA ligase [Desulfurococcales archaeon]